MCQFVHGLLTDGRHSAVIWKCTVEALLAKRCCSAIAHSGCISTSLVLNADSSQKPYNHEEANHASKHMNFVVTCSQVFSISTLHGHVTFSQRYDLALVLLSNYLYRQSDTSDVVELSLVKP